MKHTNEGCMYYGLAIIAYFSVISCQSMGGEKTRNIQLKQALDRQSIAIQNIQEKLTQLQNRLDLMQNRYQDLMEKTRGVPPSSPLAESVLQQSYTTITRDSFWIERYWPFLNTNAENLKILKQDIQKSFQNQNFQETIRLAKQLYAQGADEPCQIWAHRYRAESYFRLSLYPLAAADLQEFIEKWPNSPYVPRASFLAAQSLEHFDIEGAKSLYHKIASSAKDPEFVKAAQSRLKALIQNPKAPPSPSIDNLIRQLESVSD